MKRKMLFVLSLFLLLFFGENVYAQNTMLDVVYLKNGSIIKGIIVENTPNVNVKLRTADGNLFVYTYDEIEKFAKEEGNLRMVNNLNTSTIRTKSPGLAFLFSFIVPGGGQYYNGQIGKGITMSSIHLGSIILMTAASNEGDTELAAASALVLLGNCIWSMIDAPVTANKINKRNAMGFVNLDLGNEMYLSLKPDIQIVQSFQNPTGKPESAIGLKLKLTL